MPMDAQPGVGRGAIVGEVKQLHRFAIGPDDPPGAGLRHRGDFETKVAVDSMRALNGDEDDAAAGEIAFVQRDGRAAGVRTAHEGRGLADQTADAVAPLPRRELLGEAGRRFRLAVGKPNQRTERRRVVDRLC
jgi:hypothetical protein